MLNQRLDCRHLGESPPESRLAVVKNQRIGETEHRGCGIRKKTRYRGVNFARLPDVILVAEQINVSLDTLRKLEECTRNT
jgi:hypothetical protein